MAQQITTRIIDDISGEDGAELVRFSIEGKAYEIDLAEANKHKLLEFLAVYVQHARRATGRNSSPSVGQGPRATTAQGRAATDQRNQAIREWAKANGFQVSERGRISSAVLEAYDKRDQGDSVLKNYSPEPEAKPSEFSTIADPFIQPTDDLSKRRSSRAVKGKGAGKTRSDAPLPTDENIMEWVRNNSGNRKVARSRPTSADRTKFMNAHMTVTKQA